jgi:hypothetical protein
MDTKTFAIVGALATICVTIISIFAIIYQASWTMTGIIVGIICATITVIIPVTQSISLRLKRKKKDDSTEVDVGIKSHDRNVTGKLQSTEIKSNRQRAINTESATPVRNVIYLDLTDFGFGVREEPIEKFGTFNDLLDTIYINYLNKNVNSFSYGRQWILKNSKTNNEIEKAGKKDNRTLKELGLFPSIELKVTLIAQQQL